MIASLLSFLIGAHVLFAALCGGPQVDDLVAREAHHGYIGIALIVLFGWHAGLTWWFVGEAVGHALLWDDAIQHAIQRWARWPAFRSPIHRYVVGPLWRLAVWRKLDAWANGVFR